MNHAGRKPWASTSTMTATRACPGALNQGLRETDAEIRALRAENEQLRRWVRGLQAQIAVLAAPPAPAADSEHGLRLVWSTS